MAPLPGRRCGQYSLCQAGLDSCATLGFVRKGMVIMPLKPGSRRKGVVVFIIIAVLLLALILGGFGFMVHVLWWIALAVLVIWLLGFLFHTAATAGGPRRRWYRW